MKRTRIYVTLLLISLIVAFQISEIYFGRRHTLSDRSFVSSKLLLAKGVMGAKAFMTTGVAVSSNQLDLGAWFGFQELFVDRDFTPPFEVEWSYRLPHDDRYVSFLFGHDQTTFDGLRVSRDTRFPPMAFRSVDQEFVRKEPLLGASFESEGRIRCAFQSEATTCFRGGQQIWQGAGAGSAPLRLGFRGGFKSVFVDDLVVRSGDGRVLFQEDFGVRVPVQDRVAAFLVSAIAVFLLLLIGDWAIWRRRSPSIAFFAQLTAGLSIVVCLTIVLFALPKLNRLYPFVGQHAKEDERRWANSQAAQILELAHARYREQHAGRRLILMLGSS